MTKRRELIILLARITTMAVAVAWSLGARGQPQPTDRGPRRVGVFMDLAADNPEGQARLAAFMRGLQDAGWSVGGDVLVEPRWRAGDAERMQRVAAELVREAPDVILGSSTPVIAALLRESRAVPIVFTTVVDPVGAGFVESLARPGGNVTGFAVFEPDMGGKWLEILREIAPVVRRAAVIRDPSVATGLSQLAAIEAEAARLGIALTPIDVRDANEIERGLTAFAQDEAVAGGIIVTGSPAARVHRERIIGLASRYRLPAVYPYRHFVEAGGLIAYGPDLVGPFRRAAGYVDRILKGTKPSDLPVQAPTELHMVINLRTAAALSLAAPASLLVRADEVIE